MRAIAVSVLVLALFAAPLLAQAEETRYDVIVVGGGAGGLGAAARLAAAGQKVLLLEQHDKFGGYMTAFERGNYRFEASLHMLNSAGPGGDLYELLHRYGVTERVKMNRLDPLYRSIFPHRTFDVPADRDKYETRLGELFPHEKKGFAALIKKISTLRHHMDQLSGLFSASGFKRALLMLGAPIRQGDVLGRLNSTLDELLSEELGDPDAKGAFAQLWGYLGLPPERLSALYFAGMWAGYHEDGGYYPEGGSQAISDAMAQFIVEHGGTVRTGTLVERILTADGRVRGVRVAGGAEYFADYVVSNASAPTTVDKLVGPEQFPADYVKRVHTMERSLSLMQIYLGIKDRRVLAPLGGNHSTFVNTTYRPQEMVDQAVAGDLQRVGYVIVDYGPADPTCAPPGGSVVVITVPLQYDWEHRWHRDEGYAQYTTFKTKVAEQMLERVERLLPGLRASVEVMEIGTPLTNERFTLNPQGAVYGWAHTPGQSIINRLPAETPVSGLYLAGAWTFPGGGQSACLMSGEIAGAMVLKAMGR